MDRHVSEPELKHAIKELYYWVRGNNPDNFTALLYVLIQKADLKNKALLRTAFPAESRAFDLWQSSGDERVFFEQWGLLSNVKF